MLDLPHNYDFRGDDIAWGVIGEGQPLVLLHGTPFSSQVWRRIAPLLAKSRTVYYFDLLGYGRSEMHADQDVSLGIQNQVFAALLAYWRLDRPEVLAHDFGGATALRTHYLNGVSYRKLSLVDPVAVAPWGSPFVSHVRAYEKAFAELPAYAHEAMLRAYIRTAARSVLSDAVLDIYCAPWHGAEGQAAFYRQIAQMDQSYTDEIEKHYAPPSFPIQILWGEDDDWVPLSRGNTLSKRLTNGQLDVIPESGHLMQEDRPEAIVSAMST